MKNIVLAIMLSVPFSLVTVASWEVGMHGFTTFFVGFYILIAFGLAYEENKGETL